MQMLLIAIAVAVFALTIADVFLTVFSTQGAGLLTRTWTRLVWRGLLALHARRPMHHVLALVGPLMLALTILSWYLLLGLALFLVLISRPASLTHSSSGATVTSPEALYFVNTTISGLGYGDIVPSGFPWTMLSTGATLLGTVIITVSLSYVLSVLSAAIERRKVARSVFSLGSSATEIIERLQLTDTHASLKPYLLALCSDIEHQALKQLAYPVVKYFHSESASYAPARALLLLSDTCFLLRQLPAQRRPPVGLLELVQSSIGTFADLKHARIVQSDTGHDAPPPQLVREASKLELDIELGSAFALAFERYVPARKQLVALCHEDGWGASGL